MSCLSYNCDAYVLADLLEEGVRVGSGDVPVIDDASLFEPLLRLLEGDEVARGVGLPVAGEAIELAAEALPGAGRSKVRPSPRRTTSLPHLDMSMEYLLSGSVLVSNWWVDLSLVKPPYL